MKIERIAIIGSRELTVDQQIFMEERIADYIIRYKSTKIELRFVSGNAEGADQVANRFTYAGMVSHILPYKSYNSSMRIEGVNYYTLNDFNRNRVSQYISLAHRLFPWIKEKKTSQPYIYRNMAIVYHADVVFWTTKDNKLSGGTKYGVIAAKHLNKRVYQIKFDNEFIKPIKKKKEVYIEDDSLEGFDVEEIKFDFEGGEKNMKEIFGDAIKLRHQFTYLAITTNGFVKRNGAAVMGAGIAKTVRDMRDGLDQKLGRKIKENGNIVQKILPNLIAFPVKHNWWEAADIELIKESCRQLMKLLGPNETVLLPRPGCGNGKLQWDFVKREIEDLLDDRVTIVNWKKESNVI